jgi:hypothetical protein
VGRIHIRDGFDLLHVRRGFSGCAGAAGGWVVIAQMILFFKHNGRQLLHTVLARTTKIGALKGLFYTSARIHPANTARNSYNIEKIIDEQESKLAGVL